MDPGFVAIHSELPWMEMRGIRNKVIHEYFDMDWDIVWTTVKHDLPALKAQIEAVLAACDPAPGTDNPAQPQ